MGSPLTRIRCWNWIWWRIIITFWGFLGITVNSNNHSEKSEYWILNWTFDLGQRTKIFFVHALVECVPGSPDYSIGYYPPAQLDHSWVSDHHHQVARCNDTFLALYDRMVFVDKIDNWIFHFRLVDGGRNTTQTGEILQTHRFSLDYKILNHLHKINSLRIKRTRPSR